MSAAPSQLLGGCLLVVLLTSCSKRSAGPPSVRDGVPRSVQTEPAQLRRMERTVIATGSLLAHEETVLSVKVPGRLTVLAVDLGSRVEPGDLIVQIEPRDYELRRDQAAAALAQARAALGLSLSGDDDRIAPEQTSPVRQARAVLDEAEANRERVVRLSQQGISSAAERDTVEAGYQVAKNRYETALDEARTKQAALAQRRAEFDLAAKQLTDTQVRAPFAGAVQARIANLGEYVATGSPVVRLVKTDPLRLRLELSERDAHPVRLGQPVRFTLEGSTNRHEATLARLSPALDNRSRIRVAEADVPNDGRLQVGAFVRAQIVVGDDDEGVAIPPNALVVFAGLEKVVLVREGKAFEQPVVTGRRGDNWIEVVSGLQVGQPVILDPGNLQTGRPVKVEGADAPSAPVQAQVH